MKPQPIWYLRYYDLPLCLTKNIPIHSDKKEEFDELDWLQERAAKHHVILELDRITIHQMNSNLFYKKGIWPQ